jgi:hypothetical protein
MLVTVDFKLYSIAYICGVMAEVDMFKKFDFVFSVDMSYLNGVL